MIAKKEKDYEGANAFTDFFQRDSPFDGDPAEEFTDFMNNHEMDFMHGKVRRVKND